MYSQLAIIKISDSVFSKDHRGSFSFHSIPRSLALQAQQNKLGCVQRMDCPAQQALKGSQLETHFQFISFRCDPGFSGPACEMASQTFPMFISESFGSSRLSSYHNFYSIRGAEVSFGCGVLASGKALVFNKDGRRQLITSFLDSSQSR